MYFLTCSNVHDDVTSLEVCRFMEAQKFTYLENERQFLPPVKKVHELHLKGYIMVNNSFLVKVTFNELFCQNMRSKQFC